MQYVSVRLNRKSDRTYTYQWGGDIPMQVGDRVIVPANYLNEYPTFGDVMAVSDTREEGAYKGPLVFLLGKVDEDG